MPQHTGTMQILFAWLGCLIIGNIHKLVDTFHDCVKMIFPLYHWPQLQRAPIKFGWFIKLYNINVKVLYKQANMGFAAKVGFFWGGGKGGVLPQKRV